MRAIPGLLITVFFAATSHAEGWHLVELPAAPAGWSVTPRAINDAGRIAGDFFDFGRGFVRGAFVLDGSRWTDLGTLGGASTRAVGLNGRGEVVGQSDTAWTTECWPDGLGGEFCVEEPHAFVWRDGVMHDLGARGAWSTASGINDAGQVAGSSASFAQRWVRQDPTADVFGTFGGTCNFSSAAAVNARGQVVGYASVNTGWSHAFLWDPRSGLIDLGTLGGPTSYATAISDAGHVVGVSETATVRSCVTNEWGTFCTYEMHGFLWKDGEMIDLGTLGGPNSTPRGVNSRGEVTGDSDTAEKLGCFVEVGQERCNYRTHAFVWSDGAMIDLGDAGRRSFATGINDQGDIVGVAERADRRSRPVVWRQR